MYKLELWNSSSPQRVEYYFAKELSKRDKLAVCLEYLEYLLEVDPFWKRATNKFKERLSFREAEGHGTLQIMCGNFVMIISFKIKIEEIRTPRPLNAFLTSSHAKIREIIKSEISN